MEVKRQAVEKLSLQQNLNENEQQMKHANETIRQLQEEVQRLDMEENLLDFGVKEEPLHDTDNATAAPIKLEEDAHIAHTETTQGKALQQSQQELLQARQELEHVEAVKQTALENYYNLRSQHDNLQSQHRDAQQQQAKEAKALKRARYNYNYRLKQATKAFYSTRRNLKAELCEQREANRILVNANGHYFVFRFSKCLFRI